VITKEVTANSLNKLNKGVNKMKTITLTEEQYGALLDALNTLKEFEIDDDQSEALWKLMEAL